MSYFTEVYKKRGSWWGETSKDQYLNIAKKYFEDYLLTSPNASSITFNNVEIVAAVHDNIQDENKISKYFLIGLDTEINQGDLIYWMESYWLVIQREKRNFEAYNKILALKCNYTLKWIDNYGVLNTSPSYIFGGMAAKVVDNFKMANGLISPQPNKNIEVILPYAPIKTNQRFIVRDEAWRVLERDLISVDGILYMYLAEDLVDSFDDNLVLDIADYDSLNSAYIDIGLTTLTLGVGGSFTFSPVLYKDNKVVEGAEFTYESREEDFYISINSNSITGLAAGVATFIVASMDQPELTTTCTINVASVGVAKNVLQLVGDSKIRWGRTRTYTTFYNNGGTPTEIASTFTLINNETNLVTFVTQGANSCSIIGNVNGLAGIVTLRATTAHGTIDKQIFVVSVW